MNKIIFPTFVFLTLTVGSVILNTSFRPVFYQTEAEMPEKVKAIIDNSCFECHNTGSQNEDAREALDFKTFDELKKVRKITKLKEMAEMVEEGEMPPKKFLEKNPEKALTKEQVKILTDWANKEIKTLIGN